MISNSSTRCSTQLRRTLVYTATFVALAALTNPVAVWAATNAARIVHAIGDVSATDSSGTRRPVKKGDFIVSGDTVVTAKGRAQLKLTDGGFVALNPDTEYAIEEYEYDAAAPSKSRSFFNLLKGGVRMVTGAVARSNRRGWRMRTSVATISIRGSGGYFRYVNPNTLRVSVDFGGFTSADPETGLESDLGPGEYVCSSPCKPVDGPGDQEDGGYLTVPEREPDGRGNDQPSDTMNIFDPGPAPDNTHISYALSVLQTSGGTFELLNADEDGEVTDGADNVATFGTLENFSFGTPPDPPQVYDRNNATEIADPTGPSGATVNTELSAAWGRVLQSFFTTIRYSPRARLSRDSASPGSRAKTRRPTPTCHNWVAALQAFIANSWVAAFRYTSLTPMACPAMAPLRRL